MADEIIRDIISGYSLKDLINIIDYGKLVKSEIEKKQLSHQKLVSLILCKEFKIYVDSCVGNYVDEDGDYRYFDEIRWVFEFIRASCNLYEIRLIIKNIFNNNARVIGDSFIYMYDCWIEDKCVLFKLMKIIWFCKDIFIGKNSEIHKHSNILAKFGIQKYHIEGIHKISTIGNNVIQSTRIFRKLLRKFDYKYHFNIYNIDNIQLMKYAIKRKLAIFRQRRGDNNYNDYMMAGLCYTYKLLPIFRTSYSGNVIPFGLIHRKSLDVIDDDIIKNKTKKTYNFMQKILMKFAGKNCSKMILYYV